MEIISVQVGRIRSLGQAGDSGIDKQPTPAIHVATDGVRGDEVADTRVHGGPGQAVYVYSREDYAHFEAALGVTLPPGTFGENVTVDAFPQEEVRVGDRLTCGAVELELSGPRVPCVKFAARMREVVGDDATGWVKRFAQARRPGWYFRVLAPGELRAGDRFEVTPAPDGQLTGLELLDLQHDRNASDDVIARMLEAPIPDRMADYLRSLSA